MDNSTQLGRMIGMLAVNQSNLSSQISPDESDPLMTLFNNEEVVIEGVMTLNTLLFSTSGLVWDHPVYGDLDVFAWDEGYASTILINTYII